MGDVLVMMLEFEDFLGEIREGREVVRCKHLALKDREIDLDLVKPAGVNWSVHEYEVGESVAESFDGRGAAMGRPVVDDPENAARVTVGALSHGLGDQGVEGRDTVLMFTATEDSHAMDIKSGEVYPGSEPPVFVLSPHGQARLGWQRWVFPRAGLDAGLFVRADYKLVRPQPAPVPEPVIEVEDPTGLLPEVGVAGENPAAMLPRTDGILVKPPPDGRVADSGDETRTAHVRAEFRQTPARQRQAELFRQLAGDGLNANDELWGGKPEDDQVGGDPRGREDVVRRTVCATC